MLCLHLMERNLKLTGFSPIPVRSMEQTGPVKLSSLLSSAKMVTRQLKLFDSFSVPRK